MSTCYYKCILSAFHFNFLFGVFGHCKASWIAEMCLLLSLFSDPVIVPGFSSAWSNLCHVQNKLFTVCFYLFLTYIA